MTREEFKIYAHGQFSIMNFETTIDKDRMRTYVEGVLLGYDMITKLNPKQTDGTRTPLTDLLTRGDKSEYNLGQ